LVVLASIALGSYLMTVHRLRERTATGYAPTRSYIAGEDDHGVEEVARGKVNCPDCLRIIRHAKAIPKPGAHER